MKPQMMLTDLDKTLLRSDGSISEHTKQVLKQCRNQGIRIAIATARYWIGAERYIREIRPDYEITTDGTLIHQQEKQIYSCSMEQNQGNQIIRDLLDYDPETEITVASGRQVFWNSRHIAESERLYKAVYHDYSLPLSCPVNKIAAELPHDRIAAEIAEKTIAACSATGEKICMLFAGKSGKIQAILELTRLFSISLKEIVAFGDDGNDVEMLQICGMGVAVSNAVAEAKNAADCITLSNDQDGVAHWMEQNVLRKNQ